MGRGRSQMLRRVVAPILRLLLAIAILAVPLLLAAIANADDGPQTFVSLRPVALATRAGGAGSGPVLPASSVASLVERRGEQLCVEASGRRGWAEASAFLALDDPAES